MSNATTIEWTDRTANPVRFRTPEGKRAWHCEKVSAGCKNCYAERLEVKRMGSGRPFTPEGGKDLEAYLDDGVLRAILARKKAAKFFLGDMTDLFGHWVKDEWLDAIFATMALCPQHTFQILTKRPERMAEYMNESTRETGRWDSLLYDGRFPWPSSYVNNISDDRMKKAQDFICENVILPNVWLGTSIEDQPTADARVPHLLKTPAAVRFLSYEPALGPVNLGFGIADCGLVAAGGVQSAIRNSRSEIDWVICGGESGPGARPMHPQWARSVRDQCVAAGVPFFFKQWGEWLPSCQGAAVPLMPFRGPVQVWRKACDDPANEDAGHYSFRIGKKAAGRTLDDMEWSQFPNPQSPIPTPQSTEAHANG